jgi:hypothetical protein
MVVVNIDVSLENICCIIRKEKSVYIYRDICRWIVSVYIPSLLLLLGQWGNGYMGLHSAAGIYINIDCVSFSYNNNKYI